MCLCNGKNKQPHRRLWINIHLWSRHWNCCDGCQSIAVAGCRTESTSRHLCTFRWILARIDQRVTIAMGKFLFSSYSHQNQFSIPNMCWQIGPEKGVMHLAVAAIVNALWDLWARLENKPLWRLLADMDPEVSISHNYLSLSHVKVRPVCHIWAGISVCPSSLSDKLSLSWNFPIQINDNLFVWCAHQHSNELTCDA